MPKNWKAIDPNFPERLEKEWEEQGFTFEEVRDWVNIGLTPADAGFATWLEEEGYTALAVLDYADTEELRKDYQYYLANPQPKPTKNWWTRNKNLLLIAGAIVLIIIIYNNK